MDTLFRLVSLQSNSSTATSSYHTNNNHPGPYFSSSTTTFDNDEVCNNNNNNNFFMDEDFSSSSSSKHPIPPPPPPPASFDFSSSGPHWSHSLLTQCAQAVSIRDTDKVQQLMWTLNELSSPYGDTDQKLSAYFLQALFSKLTSSGPRTLRTLSSASDRSASFDSTRRVALRFQDLSPWSSFGHVAANGAILESFLSDSSLTKLHILDLSNTFCTQWPTLLESLATRSSDETPHLTITTLVSSSNTRVMKEISARMEKFARLMGVPFCFNVVHGDLSGLDLSKLGIDSDDTALAINCVNALHSVPLGGRNRDSVLGSFRRLRPRIVTVVEEVADLGDLGEDEGTFLKIFKESLRYFNLYFDSLEECFPKTSNERLALERAAGRAVVDIVGCPGRESAERRERADAWAARMRNAGFVGAPLSDDVADDVRALLRRYREGWAMEVAAGEEDGVVLTWKGERVVWASAWRVG